MSGKMRMRLRRASLSLVALGVAAGCGGSFRDDPSVVKRLRILAIAADQPALAPGGRALLSALVADPHGQGRAISQSWGICVPLIGPAAASGTMPGEAVCADPANRVALTTAGVLDVPTDALAGLSPADQLAGIDIPVTLVVSAGSDRHIALKRVHVSSGPTVDHDPIVSALAINGITSTAGAIVVHRGDSVSVAPTIFDPDPNQFSAAYLYATDGGFGDVYSASSGQPLTWTVGAETGEAWIYAVAFDGAGGIGWAARKVTVQ